MEPPGEKPILQVALDFLELGRAIQVARESVKGGVDWIEVGTPLIKSEGMHTVRKVRETFPEKTIVADLKTMDTGRLETEMAFKSGAEVAVLLGVADDTTVREAAEAADNYGGTIMVDLINVAEPVERAKKLEKIGADIICIHVGIDQQMEGMDPLSILKETNSVVSTPLGIAGGITSESAGKAVKKGADIVIVGGAITKSEDAAHATAKIKEAMMEEKVIKAEKGKKARKRTDIMNVLQEVSVPNISDALHRGRVLTNFKPVLPKKIVGRAVTVRAYPGDWAKPVEAIDEAHPKSIIVVDAGGERTALWGELASRSCKLREINGAIVYGGVRDIAGIREIEFPVYAAHFSGQAGEPKGFGEINIPIEIKGVQIHPGDYIVASLDGVIVIPEKRALEVANRALDVKEREDRIMEEIRRGKTLSELEDLYKWEKVD